MDKSKKIFLIFTALFLGCILIVGIVFGTIAIVKGSGSVMKYKGIYLDEGVANYLSASYKNDFINTYACTDSEEFWNSLSFGNKTNGEILEESTEEYLKHVLIGSYLFDRNSKLTKDDKAVIDKAIDEVLAYRADGSVERFNEIGAAMGFDFKDFKKAAELLYKYEMAELIIFGYEGVSLAMGGFDAECNEYFKNNYSKVRLMIIRTDNESESGTALAKVADIREKINDGRMNEEAFLWHIQNEYPTNTPNDTDGYYFSKNSSYSKQFIDDALVLKDGADKIVDIALSMDEGEYAECELSYGVCFIYKCELGNSEDGAYNSSSLERFFEDFYKLAVPYVYIKTTEVFIPDVKVKDRYKSDYVISQPVNDLLVIRFG